MVPFYQGFGSKHQFFAQLFGGKIFKIVLPVRSTSSSNVNNQLMTQSLYSRRSSERDPPDVTTSSKAKRATSAHGLNQSGEGKKGAFTTKHTFCTKFGRTTQILSDDRKWRSSIVVARQILCRPTEF
jgi:hypothetical protein